MASPAVADPGLVAFFDALNANVKIQAPKHKVGLQVYYRTAQQALSQVCTFV